ncbi:MAG: hypothetical protein WCI51_14635 [Lentisphaerota bacterium]
MTYGFGFWRSGYQALIPWNWRWITYCDDHFDYLRDPSCSGCGNRLDENGNVIPAIYWECFREGVDDYRYLYTLEQVTIARQNNSDSRCQALVRESKALVQQIWDSITPQEKYLFSNMWVDEEFNAVRWRIAVLTGELLKFPAASQEIAPSVIADTSKRITVQADVFEWLKENGVIEKHNLGENNFAKWRTVDKEATAKIVNSNEKLPNRPILQVNFKVDYKIDGSDEFNGKYPIGWPAIQRVFAVNEVELNNYDYLVFNVKIDSDRDEVADDHTPVIITLSSHESARCDIQLDLGGIQRKWLPVRISIRDFIKKSNNDINAWKYLKALRFAIAESSYKDGTNISFEFDDIALFKVKYPIIETIECANNLLLPAEHLKFSVSCMGITNLSINKEYFLRADLKDKNGNIFITKSLALSNSNCLTLNIIGILPGSYLLDVAIIDRDNNVLSLKTHNINAINGFLEDNKK